MTTIGITGASGELGRAATDHVLRANPDTDLVLLTRNPEALTGSRSAGSVRIRHADFDAPEELPAAFDDIDVLLLISTDAVGRRAAQHRAAIAAAAKAGVARVVYTSATNPHVAHPVELAPLMRDHAETEAALQAAGMSWTILRNALYLDAFAPVWAQSAATGTLVSNNGTGRHAPVARDDCAAAAAAALTTAGHDNATYNISGAQLIDDETLAALLSTAYGRTVEVVAVSDQEYAAGLQEAGLPPAVADPIVGFGASIRGGLLEAPLGDTERLIGRAPISVEAFLSPAGA
ncbi:NAD(P)-dependent oxidoreductase [Mycolicibacterium chitae]|uniref:Putative nucleoside-diphosphate sugar epimerase n=1 Tax=Mycolicibacterium chitae TaxID=1792 RepID=A0A448I9G8_MYCCI|nr:NAD(P)H-binding protein [Mycolicibacterium chitae]MCV7104481.1 NAD(P)H-binding protein [Mycolicibacterium chitae]BBZ05452.1 NAD(P)-dependent oxidoreductase [Mycolicibacterium chitae]VEG49068.1 putative nucleoside-diphosphate sugar epimerase [Mycolicibacterium chitae]